MQKNMVRACGLSLLAALSLMAFAAAGAQAEELKGTPGKIKVGGSEALATSATVTGEQVGAGTLLIPALNTEIVCQKADVLNGKILSGPNGEGLGEILYLECEYWGTKTVKHAGGAELLELTTKLPCEILEHGTLAAKAILAKALLLVVLHKNPDNPSEIANTYVLVEPDPAGQPLAGLLVTTPGECPLPKLVSVTGSTVFKVIAGDLNLGQPAQVSVEIESSKGIAKLFGGLTPDNKEIDKLLFGVSEAFIDSKARLKLTGGHTGTTWGVI